MASTNSPYWKGPDMYAVYFLLSEKSGKSYIGSTEKDVKDRLAEHNRGTNVWTKTNKPFKLVYYETYICKEDAIRRERFLKTGVGNRVVKAIIKEFNGV